MSNEYANTICIANELLEEDNSDSIEVETDFSKMVEELQSLLLDPEKTPHENDYPEEKVLTLSQKKDLLRKINEIFKYLSKGYKTITNDSYYKHLKQYEGIVDSVDTKKGIFCAQLVDMEDADVQFEAEFSLNDLQFESDKELVNIGATFIWMVGQETLIIEKNGRFVSSQQTNISKFVFRRSRVLNSKKMQDAKNRANELAEFLKAIGFSNPT